MHVHIVLILTAVLIGGPQAGDLPQRRRGSTHARRRPTSGARAAPKAAQTAPQEGDVWPTAFDPNGGDLPAFKSAEYYRIDVTERNAHAYVKAAYLLLKRHGQDLSNDITNTCRDTPLWYPYVMAASNADDFDDKARAMLMRLCYAYINDVAQNFSGSRQLIQASFLSRVRSSCDVLDLHSTWELNNDLYKYRKYTKDGMYSRFLSDGCSLVKSVNEWVSDYYKNKIQKLNLEELNKLAVPSVRVPLEMTIFGAELV